MKSFKEICREESNVQCYKDRRKKCNKIIAIYTDGDGYEYAKGLEFPTTWEYSKIIANIPKSITPEQDKKITITIK